MEINNNPYSYNRVKANKYDQESKVIRGDRWRHKIVLFDILKFIQTELKIDPKTFVDFGCGTGDLTQIVFEAFPNINAYLIDGSEEMLNRARKRFGLISSNIRFECCLLEKFNFNILNIKPDIVFSSFAIHHLENNQKWALYQRIYNNLNTNGIFVLFDYFKPDDLRSVELLEFMACMDIKRRISSELKKDIPIDQIIKNDRAAKIAEGDKEASLSEHLEQFAKIGFKSVTLIFQEARLAGIIGFKN